MNEDLAAPIASKTPSFTEKLKQTWQATKENAASTKAKAQSNATIKKGSTR